GASFPNEVMQTAIEKGLKGVAVTDRNGVYGLPRAYEVQKQHPHFQLISGSEIILCDFPSVTLLAETKSGYGWMCRMISKAHANKEKTNAYLKFSELLDFADHPRAKELTFLVNVPLLEGVKSFVYPQKASQMEALGLEMNHFIRERLEEKLSRLRECTPGKIYLPIHRTLDGLDQKRWEQAQKLKRALGLNLVATNDVYYHVPDRIRLQQILTCIRKGVRLDQAGYHLFSNAEKFLKSPREMSVLFQDAPELLEETLKIAERCQFTLKELRYRYPSEWIPEGWSAQAYLEELVWKGAEWRYPQGIPEKVRAQLGHELKLIQKLEFADYFLTIWEIVAFARGKKILCQGRGSAANSIVCFCLGITSVDPIDMNLLFERFISAERGEPPDIDVDFEHERREEVIQHIYEKYGRDRAAMVATVIRYRQRSALREIVKVFDDSEGSMQKKLTEVLSSFRHPRDSPRDLRSKLSKEGPDSASALRLGREYALRKSHKRDKARDSALCDALPWDPFVQEIQDFPRHLGIHSGGFTLSADPIIEIVPVEPARMENRTVIQWDKFDLDTVGLLKVDVLSLGMLTAIRKTMDLIGMKELSDIPANDPETYQMIQKADTVGVFQIESRAQMNMLGRLRPENFYDLVIEVAIVRPGPIVGKMVHPYLRRRRKQESSESPDPRLEPILKKTLGVPIFQEQVMQIAIHLAGFTPGEADQLRRAIGAWRSSGTLEKWGRRLQEGLLQSGLPQEWVDRIFLQIQGFAEYGFPESHAASFALITYASCFLKCHYPAAFTASLVNSQPMGFYSVSSLFEDAKRHHVEIHGVCLLKSMWDCTLEAGSCENRDSKGSIRSGFRLIHGMSREIAEHLIAERDRAPFESLFQFLHRTRVRYGVLHKMAMMGLFHVFGYKEREALWAILSFQMLYENGTQQLTLWSALKDSP
ncbi:MAG: error-prone DNA polymerase, partial [Bdellovibrionales bacterium]|nr:error-prone DNA polymerase [Bdellovibrionales bacterium]